MDDKLRSEVMDDIDYLRDSLCSPDDQVSIAGRLEGVMTDHEHLKLQMLQARSIIEALIEVVPNPGIRSDMALATVSHAKAFLEEKDGK